MTEEALSEHHTRQGGVAGAYPKAQGGWGIHDRVVLYHGAMQ